MWQSVIAECRSAGGQFREMTLITIQLSGAVPQDQVTLGRADGPRSRVAPRQSAILQRLGDLSGAFGTVLERSGEIAIVRG